MRQYIKDNFTPILVGMVIALSASIFTEMIESVIVKIAILHSEKSK